MDVYAFVAGNNNLILRFDYDGNGNQIYIGWAQPGSATSDSVWRIMQQTFSGNNLTGTGFPNVNGQPSGAFSFSWDNRATFSYS